MTAAFDRATDIFATLHWVLECRPSKLQRGETLDERALGELTADLQSSTAVVPLAAGMKNDLPAPW